MRKSLNTYLLLVAGLFFTSCGLKQPLDSLQGDLQTGNVLVTSVIPGGRIFIDDTPVFKITPATIMNIPVGEHTVRIYRDGYRSEPESLNIFIDGDKTVPAMADFSLQELIAPGEIFVTSSPDDARIFMDGFYAGKNTPATVVAENGPHSIQIRKNGFRSLIFSQFFLSAFDTVHVDAELQGRPIVVYESFANSSCLPCTTSSQLLEALSRTVDPSGFAVIEYFAFWPNGSDPLYLQNTSENTRRVGYYGVTALPGLYINGRQNDPLDLASMVDRYAEAVEEIEVKPLIISLSRRISDTLTVSADIYALDALPAGALRLHVAVTENEIRFESPPGSNGLTDFDHVFRKFLTGEDGELLNFDSERLRFIYQMGIPAGWQAENLEITGFIQLESTGEILTAARL